MRATDIIIKKRGFFVTQPDGKKILTGSQPNTKEEINFMVEGCVNKTIPDYQLSAWLMAIFFNGMTFEETGYLTDAMLHSGDVINFHKDNKNSDIFYVDKHSTGGVGDKISLPLAAIVSACGLRDPMMSGRALGHTGGTLDKLESIEGYRTDLTEEKFMQMVNENGYSMIGQTEHIAPADKILYALRDVTGTVESIPLITASILSKKVAEGSDGLVFDVKFGSGAFMKSKADACLLATSLVQTAKTMGKKAVALITSMETPLGLKTGNFLEIEESIECLEGNGPADVMNVTYALAAEMLYMAGLAESLEAAEKKCIEAVESGKALEKFYENVEAQGGNKEKLISQLGKRRSQFKTVLKAKQNGYIKIDAYKTGVAGVNLGVGRNKTTDKVCFDAGIIFHKTEGCFVNKDDVIMEIYGKDNDCLGKALEQLEDAVSYSENEIKVEPIIFKKITSEE
ncbi:MAG: thymidine phosphorylase [Treponema sp.]|nr:thymidine phosphorylase [Treponema sp.]